MRDRVKYNVKNFEIKFDHTHTHGNRILVYLTASFTPHFEKAGKKLPANIFKSGHNG